MKASARFRQYYRERFPIPAYAPLVAALVAAALTTSAALRSAPGWPQAAGLAAAFMTGFIAFLHLRIADEFKDYDDDMRHRPDLPVPRGLVTLRELLWLAVAGATVQLLMAAAIAPALLVPLAIVWLWTLLLAMEFFAGAWLRSRPLAYMAAHLTIMPVVALYLTAFDWLAAGTRPPAGLAWFLAVAFFAGAVLEIGRKTRAPGVATPGVVTYSEAWGSGNAALAWLIAVALMGMSALAAGWAANVPGPMALFAAALLAGAMIVVRTYRTRPEEKTAKMFELASGVGVLATFLVLAISAALASVSG